MNDITKTLKDLRNQNNISQADLAKRMGMSQSAYSKLENNPDNVTLGQYKQLAKIHRVELGLLLGIDDDYKKHYETFLKFKQIFDQL